MEQEIICFNFGKVTLSGVFCEKSATKFIRNYRQNLIPMCKVCLDTHLQSSKMIEEKYKNGEKQNINVENKWFNENGLIKQNVVELDGGLEEFKSQPSGEERLKLLAEERLQQISDTFFPKK